MSTITPQDLGSSISVLEFLLNYAETNNNVQMREEVERLITDYYNVMTEPDISDMTLLPYNRRDAYSILEYLKLQAEQLSEGRWTDFSDSDIGTVFLKLMSYLADMNNFQIDKAISELYLDTCVERASAIALCALIGYEPRHYQSAISNITLGVQPGQTIPDGTIIPAYSIFTNSDTTIKYCNLKQAAFYGNVSTFKVYEGTPVSYTFTMGDITTLGRIVLPDYNIGTNTISVKINGVEYEQVEDVRFISGELGFSVHIAEDAYLYLQLPSYWSDIITQSSVIEVKYLLSSGADGRIGKNILTRIYQLSSDYLNQMMIIGNTATTGGYNPETVDELRDSVPIHARTMNTIVTIKDFEELGSQVLGIADVAALDYNDPSSGLIQPDDYYKVYMYVLPDADNYDVNDEDLLKYRNTIIKEREDWELSDLEKVAEDLETYSQASITGNSITLTGAATIYENMGNIVVGVDTGIESTSYLAKFLGAGSGTTEATDEFSYRLQKSGNDWIILLNRNWRGQLESGDKVAVYFKREQILTDRGQALREYVDERRLMSLNVTYHDLDIVQPQINIDIYMDRNDIRFKTIGAQVKEFILDKYSRKYLKIGEPIFASVIGSDILTEFDFIRYCEVGLPTFTDDKIEVLPRGFIDVVPYVLQEHNGDSVIVNKINIQVFDYQNRQI